MISAKVIADSKNEFGNRITTMVLTFPRYILAELNTHRMMSRNSASSRAIPYEKLLKSVQENPFIPIAWMKDHKGMQGTEYHTSSTDIEILNNIWLTSRNDAIQMSTKLSENNVTKQLCNRLLEPYMWHTVIVTATEWENFFYLRCPKYSLFSENMPMEFRSRKDLLKYVHHVEAPEFKNQYDDMTDLGWLSCNKGQADIHMMALAEAMWDAYNESEPKELKAGEWHIPFGDKIDGIVMNGIEIDFNTGLSSKGETALEQINSKMIKIATARCARVSYTVVGEEGKPDNYDNDIKLHDRLVESGHMSPFEHCAKAMNKEEYKINVNGKCDIDTYGGTFSCTDAHPLKDSLGWSGNFKGFIQDRKTLANENRI